MSDSHATPDRAAKGDDLLNYAWTIICNVSEGDWSREHPDWQKAALKFREQYHAYLDEVGDRETTP